MTRWKSKDGHSFLIVGAAGNAGARVARLLGRELPRARIVLAGRSEEPLRALAAEIDATGERASALPAEVRLLDVSNADDFARCLDGIDMAVIASSTAQYTDQVIEAVIASEADYLDIQLSNVKLGKLKAKAERIEQAGVLAVTDGGCQPGLSAAMVRYAATKLDAIESAKVAFGAFMDWASHTPSRSTGEELLAGLKGGSLMRLVDGKWEKLGFGAMSKGHKVDFGPPLGVRACRPNFIEELLALPETFPTLKNLELLAAGLPTRFLLVSAPIGLLGMAISPRRAPKALAGLMAWGLRASSPPFDNVLRVDADGQHDGQPRHVTARVSMDDGYDFTAVATVACLLQWADGAFDRAGLITMANVVEPVRLVGDLQRMGARFSEEVS